MPPIKFRLSPTYGMAGDIVWRIYKMVAIVSIRYRNETILAILNFHVSPLPPVKFRFNQTYRSGGDVNWRFWRWPPWRLSWISEWNNFSNSESPCSPIGPHAPPPPTPGPHPKFQLSLTYDSGILVEMSKMWKSWRRTDGRRTTDNRPPQKCKWPCWKCGQLEIKQDWTTRISSPVQINHNS